MSSIGRIVNSVFSATNENTIALANLNFDFSLFKFDAPKEFKTVGDTLSTRRRDDAEAGKIHRTARRLGALFQALVPSVPSLIRAYGTRASEIASLAKVNPKANPSYGPFQEFVGIDSTSLWAAATSARAQASAHAPLAVHLLACILAKAWDADKAVAIWVEIVNERQAELKEKIGDEPQILGQYMASQQEITREELASWDASARAWLRSADEAKEAMNTKLRLIVENISIEVTSAPTTYRNVMQAWQDAMSGMEQLLKGVPQDASNGAVLLAAYAWHLYPDLTILGSTTKHAKFNDPLVNAGGIVTVGLQFMDGRRPAGLHWSLTLSELRYYENAVPVTSREQMTRVKMDELLVVAFGGLLSHWGIARDEEVVTAEWLVEIWEACLEPHEQLYSLKWLQTLQLAAQCYLCLHSQDDALCSDLVKWGRRRGKVFLGMDDTKSFPFFNLRNPHILNGLSCDFGHEAAIAHLRSIAESLNPLGHCYVIRYKRNTWFEYATAVPHPTGLSKRTRDGQIKIKSIHHRWLPHNEVRTLAMPGQVEFSWSNIPPMLARGLPHSHQWDLSCPSLANSGVDCACAEPRFSWPPWTGSASFVCCYGDPQSYGLFVSLEGSKDPLLASSLRMSESSNVTINESLQYLRSRKASPSMLVGYLNAYSTSWDSHSVLAEFSHHRIAIARLLGKQRLSQQCLKALRVLGLAAQLYKTMPGSTVSLKITSMALSDASWLKNANSLPGQTSEQVEKPTATVVGGSGQLSKPQSFACIVMFESGHHNVDADDCEAVIAIAMDNSVYVSSDLLSDPLEVCQTSGTLPRVLIQRIPGNVGMPGISLLVPPQQRAKIRPLSNDLRVVPHLEWDGRREDNFASTSLHLSFTRWRRPLSANERGAIDEGLSYVESVISVHDRGQWVGDIDPFATKACASLSSCDEAECACGDEDVGRGVLTSLDSWEEVIDAPDNVGIVRAHGNWSARLAASHISCQTSRPVVLARPDIKICRGCLIAYFADVHGSSSGIIVD
ncbi:hypothetical protein H2198_010779 [Neophaeococcomyces mojaviensis]|uniref:Uncharacterized protein n=1 Tax=Neophaeococcomyces mojaviensis TaxID=3383035 RepID=A0ACC2ZQU1_9EURO|nr:hypothetical protein H2198_010779 [Knufia sp. JES_112]